jgi:hypothetical protein
VTRHQPASSRATAKLATNGFFLRSRNRHHCWCRRRFGMAPHFECWVDLGPAGPHGRTGIAVGLAVMPAALISSRRTWTLRALVIDSCTGEASEEYSLGTKPTKAPMEDPVKRVHSPISTVSASPEIPCRQPRRSRTAVAFNRITVLLCVLSGQKPRRRRRYTRPRDTKELKKPSRIGLRLRCARRLAGDSSTSATASGPV